jgi:hypothetical protein
MLRPSLALIVTIALTLSCGVPAAAFSAPDAGHSCCTRIARTGCEHPTISCCPPPAAPSGEAQVPPGASMTAATPLVVMASGPWAPAVAADAASSAAALASHQLPPDPSEPLYLRHSVLLV